MDNFWFSINAITPIFLIVLLGTFLRRIKLVNDSFVSMSQKLVFNAALPALIFSDIAGASLDTVFDLNLILFAMLGTIAVFLITGIFAFSLIKDRRSAGAFIQGVFRGNFAILGIPLINNLFGQGGLAKGALVLAVSMPVYNTLAVIILTVTASQSRSLKPGAMVLNVVKNPLIIAALAAIPFSVYHIPIPEIVSSTLGYLKGLTMPLALIGMGASFSFSSIRGKIKLSSIAVFLRVLLIPALLVFAAITLGFRHDSLGVIFIFFASPTAVSSYIMAEAMGSDAELASQIVLISTVTSVFTIFIGTFILKTVSLI